MSNINRRIDELANSVHENLLGAVDFHLHSHVGQGYYWNLAKIAEDASSAGMSALVIKNFFGCSQEASHIVNKHLGRRFLYPSLTLCRAIGGLNPSAVDYFSKVDPANQIVEMPVLDSIHEIRLKGLPERDGVAVFWKDQPAPGLHEILKIIAEHNMVLKTGHISPKESLQLVHLARDCGVKRIIVTHATGAPVMATPKEQKEIADLGALIEHCLIKFMPISRLRNIKRFPNWERPIFGDLDYLKASLESVGPERCIAATDAGQTYNPAPLDSFIYLLCLLEELGCSNKEIKIMTGYNPRRMLNILDSSENA